MICSACRYDCERDEFGTNQWRRGLRGAGARCKECVEDSAPLPSSYDASASMSSSYDCGVYGCHWAGRSEHARDQHEQAAHPYCSECDRSFRDDNALRQHSTPARARPGARLRGPACTPSPHSLVGADTRAGRSEDTP